MHEKLFFQNSKRNKICGILSGLNSDTDKPVIILCHGFSTNKDGLTYKGLERILNSYGISTFRIDFYGHGESEGRFEDTTISEAVDDIINAIKFLKDKGYRRIGLMGSSFGGMVSILAASKSDDLFALALKSPVSDYLGKIIAQISRKGVDVWREKGYIFYKNKSNGEELRLNYSFFEDAKNISGYEAAKNIKIPTLIVHGYKDDDVPIEQSKHTAKIIDNCTLEVIKGADHHYSKKEDFEKMLGLISKFIVAKCYNR